MKRTGQNLVEKVFRKHFLKYIAAIQGDEIKLRLGFPVSWSLTY